MKILVCVTQVADLESDFRPQQDGSGYEEQGLVFRMNTYDEYALEEAVRIKERFHKVHITALTVGPPRTEQVLRRALEFGADHGVHILVPEPARLEPYVVASVIARYVQRTPFDLMLCGVMSEDYQKAQTGPMLAALLDLPCATMAISATISEDRSTIRVERQQEARRRHVIQMPLPAVVTVLSGINRPRYPSLSNKLRARKQDLEVIYDIDHDSLPKENTLIRVYAPKGTHSAVWIQGTIEEQADQLARIIRQKGLLF